VAAMLPVRWSVSRPVTTRALPIAAMGVGAAECEPPHAALRLPMARAPTKPTHASRPCGWDDLVRTNLNKGEGVYRPVHPDASSPDGRS